MIEPKTQFLIEFSKPEKEEKQVLRELAHRKNHYKITKKRRSTLTLKNCGSKC